MNHGAVWMLVAGAASVAHADEPRHLCAAGETVLWTCEAKAKTFSLCASPDLDAHRGYIQYRAGSPHGLDLVFPETKRHPAGVFEYATTLNGNASVRFENGGYEYVLADPLRDVAAIYVTRKSAKNGAEIRCANGNQSLQLNSNMDLMKAAGLEAQ